MHFCIKYIFYFLSIGYAYQLDAESSLTQLEVELTESGMHRDLIYKIDFKSQPAAIECQYILRQRLPSAVYVSVDQLEDLKRLNKLDVVSPPFVDIERPTEQSEEFEVLLRGDVIETVSSALPIHFRYHAPREESTFVTVVIQPPSLYTNCSKTEDDNTYCLDFRQSNIKDIFKENLENGCNWKKLDFTLHLKSALQADIPVGNSQSYPLILHLTIVASWIVSLWTWFRTRHVPREISQKIGKKSFLDKQK